MTAEDNQVFQHDAETLKTEKSNSVKIDISDSSLITLTWENVNVRFIKKSFFGNKIIEDKHLIRDVNGVAKPGQVLAIMGASGAGKTTLLNVLNYRNRGQLLINGNVKVNGQTIRSPEALASISGYVQQDDLFIGTLTVKEHLRFQAMLRMDEGFSLEERMERVEQVLTDLNLKKCEDTLIGIPAINLKGISGGERRRLGFATEIITNPSLLFCDEPTSGLDSFMALSIVESMKSLAKQGKTIVCTIHQPSSEIFELFDRLCLLAEGRLAYLGDLDRAVDFFTSQKLKCPPNYNPADFYIQKLAIVPAKKDECIKNVNKICDGFEKSTYMNEIKQDILRTDNAANNKKDEFSLFTVKKLSPYKSSVLTQFKWLTWRNALGVIRNPMTSRIQVLQTIMIAIIFGLIFLNQDYSKPGCIQNVNGVLFLLITNSSFSYLFAVINSFPPEIPIFLREHYNGLYRVIAYYLSKLMIELPILVVLPFTFVTIVYWMSNLNSEVDRFFICVITIILVAQTAASFGGFLSCVAPNSNVALGISAPILVPLMIFGGFFINNETIPKYFIWLKYLSWLGYANEIITLNQWEGTSNITRTFNTTTDGSEILAELGMKASNRVLNFSLIVVLYVTWRVLGYLSLILRTKRNK